MPGRICSAVSALSLDANTLSLTRQERKKVMNADIVVKRLTGSNIKDWHWDSFYQFYCNTVDSKWGQAYLTRQFFTLLGEKMADQVRLLHIKV